jgi:UrcA family protein
MAEKAGEDKAGGGFSLISVQLSANSCGVSISPRKPHGSETAGPYLPGRRHQERRRPPREFAMKTLASLAAVLAVSLAAGAASAQEARIGWGDLDLSSAAGADAFDVRVSVAADRLCRGVRRPGSRLSDRTFCRAAVRAEAFRLLPGAVKVDYSLSRLPIVA